MSTINIDARGDACPLPVVKTRKAIKALENGIVTVSVDNVIATENLAKMAKELRLEYGIKKISEKHYDVKITKGKVTGNEPAASSSEYIYTLREKTVVAISSDKMGEGDEKLGKALMKSFIYALSESEDPPEVVLFYNSGANITSEGSDSLDDLRALEKRGVKIMTCGACLNFYGLTEKLASGEVTNMYEIVETMRRADLVIKP